MQSAACIVRVLLASSRHFPFSISFTVDIPFSVQWKYARFFFPSAPFLLKSGSLAADSRQLPDRHSVGQEEKQGELTREFPRALFLRTDTRGQMDGVFSGTDHLGVTFGRFFSIYKEKAISCFLCGNCSGWARALLFGERGEVRGKGTRFFFEPGSDGNDRACVTRRTIQTRCNIHVRCRGGIGIAVVLVGFACRAGVLFTLRTVQNPLI